jgi:predicted nucleic acid-binding protein
MKVMLDTNILVKFAFIRNKKLLKTPIPKNLKNYEIILDKLEKIKFVNVMSFWNSAELTDVLMKLKLSEVYFLSGFSVDEFRDAKDEKIELSSKDIRSVNRIVLSILKFCETNDFGLKMDADKIQILTEGGFSSMDIILIHQAELGKCDFFVTNDTKLYLNSKKLEKYFKIKIISVKEFKDKIKNI